MKIRPFVFIIGIILIPINCIWLAQMEMATPYASGYGGGPYPTTFSLFANVILLLLILRVINTGIARLNPGWALNTGELLVLYTMLCIASAVDAIDLIDVLVPMITHVNRYDDPTAGRMYADDILQYIPNYFVLNDPDALRYWHEGRPEAFWTMNTLRAWAPSLMFWGGVLLVMLWVMLCLAGLLRRKWIDEERLGYPITYIPVQIAQTGKPGIFNQNLFWLGFAVAAGISLWNGASVFYPQMPRVPVKLQDLSPYFQGRPWNAVGWTPISFYPFGIGLGYLLPPDLLFSTWFFYWFLKGERIISSAVGFTGYDAQAPYIEEQCFGAYVYVAAFGLWLGRRYFLDALSGAFGGVMQYDDPVFKRRVTVWGIILGVVALGIAFAQAGMSVWLVVLAWGIYWLISLAVTRMRAELGPPAHDLHQGGPDHMLPVFIGTANFGKQNLNLLTWFYWFNRAYRSHPMPHMLEGFFMARRNGYSEKSVVVGIAIAAILGTVTTLIALVFFGYMQGAEAKMAGHATYFGWEAFNRLRGWMNNPTQTNFPSIGGAGIGIILALFLHKMTVAYISWPLHPLGFAIAGSYSMQTMWCPMLIAWIIKSNLLRYGGQRAYMTGVPLFVGLMVGDYTLGCLWPILGWFLGKPMYSFQQ